MTNNQKLLSNPSILIILMGSLGDVARGLCLVAHIKSHRPESRITWLVEPKWSELVRFHEQIDKVIVFKRAWRISSLWDLYQNLRQEHFDITLDLQRIFKSGFFSLLSGAGRRIGFHRRNAKEFNWVFNNEHIGYNSDLLPKIKHYLKFTEYLDLPKPTNVEFGFSTLNVKQNAPRVVAELARPYVAIVLSSSWETKNWHFEGYSDLIRRILADGNLNVVLVGDHTQLAFAADIANNFIENRMINLVGNTSLLELAAVLKAAAVGVGPDSGPGHLAAAVKTPFVTIFGPTSPRRTAPFGCEDLVVTSEMSCAPCYKKRCPEHHQECTYNINAETVMEKLSTALFDKGSFR